MYDSVSSVTGSSGPDLVALRRQMLHKMYSDMDTDDDNAVSQEELVAALEDHAPEGSDTVSVVSDIFDEYDSDADGSLSEEEFATYSASMQGPPSMGRPMGGGGMGGPRGAGGAMGSASAVEEDEDDDEETTYDPADTNEDGVVSAQEQLEYARQQLEKYEQIAAAENAAEASATSTLA